MVVFESCYFYFSEISILSRLLLNTAIQSSKYLLVLSFPLFFCLPNLTLLLSHSDIILPFISLNCFGSESDPQIEMGMKHSIIQDVVVNQVYLGGDPPLVEKFGFGKGPTGYATMQYVMAFHENDPLCQQYTSSSMSKIWLSAGLDLNTATQAAAGGKLPLAPP